KGRCSQDLIKPTRASPFLQSAFCRVRCILGSAACGNHRMQPKLDSGAAKLEFLGRALAGDLKEGALVSRKRHPRDFETYWRHASLPGKFSDDQLYLSGARWDSISWVCRRPQAATVGATH